MAAHVAGRTSSLWMLRAMPYARADAAPGVAKPLVEGLTWGRCALGLALSQGILFAICGSLGLWIGVGVCALSGVCGLYLMRRLGGMTGDTLGAVNVLCEVSVLLTYAWLWPLGGA